MKKTLNSCFPNVTHLLLKQIHCWHLLWLISCNYVYNFIEKQFSNAKQRFLILFNLSDLSSEAMTVIERFQHITVCKSKHAFSLYINFKTDSISELWTSTCVSYSYPRKISVMLIRIWFFVSKDFMFLDCLNLSCIFCVCFFFILFNHLTIYFTKKCLLRFKVFFSIHHTR